MYLCRVQTILSKSSKCARISQTLQMDTWKLSSTKKIIMWHNHEKYWEVRTYSPKFPHTLIKLLISQVLVEPPKWKTFQLQDPVRGMGMQVSPAPEPRDIVWHNVARPQVGTAASSVWSLQNVSMQCMIGLQPSLQRLHRRGGKEQYHCTILKLPDTIAGASILCGDCSPLWYLASSGNLEEKTQGGSSIQPSCEYQHHLTHWPASWKIMNKSYFTDPGCS